ncbi:MAG: thioredoxin domain-containing protein [Byssovorax sp.]
MSILPRRAPALFLAFLVGCATAPPPPPAAAPASPPVAVEVPAAPPAAAAAGDQGAKYGVAEKGSGATLELDGDESGGGTRAPAGVAARGLGGPGAAPIAVPQNGILLTGERPKPAAITIDSGVPVSAADPQWGSPNALVTIVEFADFQCPFCGKAEQTLADLRKTYGPDQLRIVWKNEPLPFHTNAWPTAELATLIFQRSGNDAFWAAHDAFFADQRNLPLVADQVAKQAGLGAGELAQIRKSNKAADKVDLDLATASAVGATGTPAFFINGIYLSGAQPIDKFSAIIDEQLKKAKDLLAKGTPANQLYDTLAKAQKGQTAQPPPAAAAAPVDEKEVFVVPIGRSAVRGKATALVTMIEFADYQCPFCVRAEGTVQGLIQQYGDKLRVVWKDKPLPFHPRAEPAAELTLEVRAQKGDTAYFQVHDALLGNAQHLEDGNLAALASGAGLDANLAMQAVANHKHKAQIDEDSALADKIGASGTPTFFINGRRLVGAQPPEKFKALIDEELAKAEAMVKAGTPANKVYDKIQANAAREAAKKPAPPKP